MLPDDISWSGDCDAARATNAFKSQLRKTWTWTIPLGGARHSPGSIAQKSIQMSQCTRSRADSGRGYSCDFPRPHRSPAVEGSQPANVMVRGNINRRKKSANDTLVRWRSAEYQTHMQATDLHTCIVVSTCTQSPYRMHFSYCSAVHQ